MSGYSCSRQWDVFSTCELAKEHDWRNQRKCKRCHHPAQLFSILLLVSDTEMMTSVMTGVGKLFASTRNYRFFALAKPQCLNILLFP